MAVSQAGESLYDKRLRSICREAVSHFGLDLSGMKVITEAASGIYLTTPLIALMAGADEVVCLGRSSAYGSVEEITASLLALSNKWGLNAPFITSDRCSPQLKGADIVTNLGMCRPLDSQLLSWIGKQVVIPYMYEAWEVRPGDVDFDYCAASGIPVLATDEHSDNVGVFKSTGMLAVRMLLEAGLEVIDNRIAVISSDPFGPAIAETLLRCGSRVELFSTRTNYEGLYGTSWDAVIVSEYTSQTTVLGENGMIDAVHLVGPDNQCPLIIQYAGHNDVDSLRELGFRVYPNVDLPSFRMSKTLADLGPRPAVFLHAAGLCVGEKLVRAKRLGLSRNEFLQYVKKWSPAQEIHLPGCNNERIWVR